MTFVLSHCTPDDDFVRYFAVVAEAFGSEHPYFDFLFPSHDTPPGREAGGARLFEAFKTDPHAVFFKVSDASQGPGKGKIVGVAKWLVFDGAVPERGGLSGDWWPTSEAKELAAYIAGEYTAERWEAIEATGGHLVCQSTAPIANSCPAVADYSIALDLMAVDPAYQRKGIGGMLLQWGLKKADQMKVKASSRLIYNLRCRLVLHPSYLGARRTSLILLLGGCRSRSRGSQIL